MPSPFQNSAAHAILILLSCASFAPQLSAAPLPEHDRAIRIGQLRDQLAATVSRLEASLKKPNPQPSTRDLTNGALAALITGGQSARAQALLQLAFDQQNMDEKSPAYGSFPWQVGHPEIKDENANTFCTQALGPILLNHREKFPADFRATLEAHARASFTALRNRKVKVNYTNIFLMKTVNLILIGEAMKDEKAAKDGYALLDEWIDYTRKTGIHEFDSPTYYNCDLNCLYQGYVYAKAPGAREKFKAIIDYFWMDIAGNYFAPRQALAGPHSRNYNFISSYAGIDWFTYIEGFRSEIPITGVDLEKAEFVDSALAANSYRLDEKTLAIPTLPRRIILSRWDDFPGGDRYHYLTPDFSIGSASHDYNAQDKLISIELAPNPSAPAAGKFSDAPVIALIPDLFDAPYGKVKTPDRSGHNKPTHPPYRPVCVQHEGVILATIDIDASKPEEIPSLATNLLIPSRAEAIIFAGKKVSLDKPIKILGNPDAVLAMRVGQSAILARILTTTACTGQTPELLLQSDPDGLKLQSARLTAYHYRGDAKKLADAHVRLAMLLQAAPCESDEELQKLSAAISAAHFTQALERENWHTSVKLGDLALELTRDKSGKPMSRTVNGKEINFDVLSINGADVKIGN